MAGASDPKFSIEGDEWFAEHEARPPTQPESPQAESPQEDAPQTEASRSEASQVEGPHETPDTHNEPTRTD